MMYSTTATAAPIRPMIATRTVAGLLAGPCTVMTSNYARTSALSTCDELDIHEWLAASLLAGCCLAGRSCQAASAVLSRTPATKQVRTGATAAGGGTRLSTAAPAAGLTQVMASSAAALPGRSPLNSAVQAESRTGRPAARLTGAGGAAAAYQSVGGQESGAERSGGGPPRQSRAAQVVPRVRQQVGDDHDEQQHGRAGQRQPGQPEAPPSQPCPGQRRRGDERDAGQGGSGEEQRHLLLGEVRDRRTGVGGAALRLLPLLLAAQGRDVQDGVRAAELLGAAAEGGVGVEHRVAVAQEAADAGLLGRPVQDPGQAGLLQLGLVAVVEHHRPDRGVDADVEVVVEVAAERRVPGEIPALARLVRRDLRLRSPGDCGEGRVPGPQISEQPWGQLVQAGRAARARVVPRRVEHDVLQHQLPVRPEHVSQARLAVGPFEDVLLVDPNHRKLAPARVERVVQLGELLLPHQELLAGGQPLLARGDGGKTHYASPVR